MPLSIFLQFKTRLSAKTFPVKMSFVYTTIKNPFYINGFARSLAQKQRLRKLSIVALEDKFVFCLSLDRLYTTVTVKCCSLVSPITVALFTGPSLSSEHVTQDFSASRDSERYPGDSLGRDSESSDSETEEKEGERNGRKGVVFKLDDWIALSASQEVMSLTVAVAVITG